MASMENNKQVIPYHLNKIDLEKQKHNKVMALTYIEKEFLMNIGEQYEYTNYLDMLPEEIINIIYRFVNNANLNTINYINTSFVSGAGYNLNVKLRLDIREIPQTHWKFIYKNNWITNSFAGRIEHDVPLTVNRGCLNVYEIKKCIYEYYGLGMNCKGQHEIGTDDDDFDLYSLNWKHILDPIYDYKGVKFGLNCISFHHANAVFNHATDKWEKKSLIYIDLYYSNNEFKIRREFRNIPTKMATKKCSEWTTYEVKTIFHTTDWLAWKLMRTD